MADTSKLVIPQLAADQAQKHVTHNEAMLRIDQLVQQTVIDATRTAPPVSPTEGDAHIVATGATGAWSGRDGHIAAWLTGTWVFLVPRAGWIVWNETTTTHVKWNGSAWVAAFAASAGSFGWHDYQDSATTVPLTTAGTWYDVGNDGLGPLSDTTFAISGHGDIFDTSTGLFDFSSLSVGDLLRIRTDMTFTTTGSNHLVESRLVFGPSYAYSLPFDQVLVKAAGDVQRVCYFPFTIKNTDALNNPAKIQVRSDASGDSLSVVDGGWQVETSIP